jgi:class 3 adenylate cyclase
MSGNPGKPVERRLAAILAADVAGFSRLIGNDEGGTLHGLRAIRSEVTDPKIAEHRGRIVKTTGDGLLVEFGSVVDALRCANEVQSRMAERNLAVPTEQRIEMRIGINVGDIVVEDGDIFGDGVNYRYLTASCAPPGPPRRGARDARSAARDHAPGHAEPDPLLQSRTPRAFPVATAADDGRDDMTPVRYGDVD